MKPSKGGTEMTAKEKTEKMINIVEEEVINGEKEDRDIANLIQEELVLSLRELNIIFPYLTGVSIRNYIRERRMMSAYYTLIRFDSWNEAIEMAIEKSMLYDQSAFSKQFKEMFGLTPKDAFKKKDKSKLKPPMSWDVITGGDSSGITNIVKDITEKKFGTDKTLVNEIIAAEDYQTFYGLSDELSETAFNISDDGDVSMEESFYIVDQLAQLMKAIDDLPQKIRIDQIKNVISTYEMFSDLFKDSDISVSYEICKPFKNNGCITLRGKNISFDSYEEFGKAMEVASSFDIWCQLDGMVNIDFGFDRLTEIDL